MRGRPTVTVVIPALNEERHIRDCLESVVKQTYPDIVEVLVVDGGSADRTRDLAAAFPKVRVLDNPRRIQAAALNRGLREAAGEVLVRVDAHCTLRPDYVERTVETLQRTGAGVVGGGMNPVGTSPAQRAVARALTSRFGAGPARFHVGGAPGWVETVYLGGFRTDLLCSLGGWSEEVGGGMNPVGTSPAQRAVARAMTSRFGAGPARFHVGGAPGWVDTVYLGGFRTDLLCSLGGWSEEVGVNEDAELAYRVRRNSGVWYDPAIRSDYFPRDSLWAVARQFYRYGRSRAMTIRKHPSSLSVRQLAPPSLLLGLVSPWRRVVASLYGGLVAGLTVQAIKRDGPAVAMFFAPVLPLMHCSWGVGFFVGLLAGPPRSARPIHQPVPAFRTGEAGP